MSSAVLSTGLVAAKIVDLFKP